MTGETVDRTLEERADHLLPNLSYVMNHDSELHGKYRLFVYAAAAAMDVAPYAALLGIMYSTT